MTKPSGSFKFEAYGQGNTTLTIKGFIGGWIANANSLIDQLSNIKSSHLTIDLNSYGGDAIEGLAIYNALNKWKADNNGKITVNIIGYAMSAASVIAMAGDTINIPENGYVMIHNPHIAGYEKDQWKTLLTQYAKELLVMAERDWAVLDSLEKAYASTYAKRTGLSTDTAMGLMAAETWLLGTQAKEKGFATDITDAVQLQDVALPTASLSSFRNMPPELAAHFRAEEDTDKGFIQKFLTDMANIIKPISDFVAELKAKGLEIVSADGKQKPEDVKAVTDSILASLQEKYKEDETATPAASAISAEEVKELKTSIEALQKQNGELAEAVNTLKGTATTGAPKADRGAPEGGETKEPQGMDANYNFLDRYAKKQL